MLEESGDGGERDQRRTDRNENRGIGDQGDHDYRGENGENSDRPATEDGL
jgi:hypothetical protein